MCADVALCDTMELVHRNHLLMPELSNNLTIEGVAAKDVYALCKEAMETLNPKDSMDKALSESPYSAELWAYVPKGTGGLELTVNVFEKDGTTSLNFKGFITQFGTTPLAKVMDKYMEELSRLLRERYGYELAYEKISNKFMPEIGWTKRDKTMVKVLLIDFAICLLIYVVMQQFFSNVGLGWSLAFFVPLVAGSVAITLFSKKDD